MKKTIGSIATVILAGGEGKRLQPLTFHHSKPAVFFGGRYRLIDIPISNAINSGFQQIFVIAQYLSAELEHHIHQTYRFDSFNPGSVDVLTPQDQWFEGTADAVRKSLPTLLKSSAEYFLILSGDQLYNMDFQDILDQMIQAKADLMIAALPVAEQEARRMGLLKIDGNHRVTDFYEKPQEISILKKFAWKNSDTHYLGSMGIYIFKREFLVSLLQSNQGPDFGLHLINTAVNKGKTFGFIYNGYWEDIGTIRSYYHANLALTHLPHSLNTYDERNPIYTCASCLPGPKFSSTHVEKSIVCEGSVIEAAEISHSVIGIRSYIKRGTIIRDSVLVGNHFYMPPIGQLQSPICDFGIGENCHIEKAIIDEHVIIGNNVRLTNRKKLEDFKSDGLFIRDGIIIIPAGTRLPDNYEL